MLNIRRSDKINLIPKDSSMKYLLILSLLFLLIANSGCNKKESSIVNYSYAVPELSDVQILNPTYNLDKITGTAANQIDTTVSFAITLNTPALNVTKVEYTITYLQTGEIFNTESIDISPADIDSLSTSRGYYTFQVSGPFQFTRADAGNYQVDLFIINKDRLKSNSFIRSISVMHLNKPPVISNLVAPDTVAIPSWGTETIFTIELGVNDPDGLSDISSVQFTTILPDGSPSSAGAVRMYDDGDLATHGDAVSNDGIYSCVVSVLPTNKPGTYKFSFVATDKLGASSNVITHNIVLR